MLTRITISILALIWYINLSGQNFYNANPKFEIPKSPNVAAFEKYGFTPVSLASGQASPNIELISTNIRGLDLNLFLNYFNSGLRTGEIPSWSGLGWSINEPGIITRSVKGIPDDEGGLLTNSARQNHTSFINGTTGIQKYQYQVDIYEGKQDGEFDLFAFNILGRSGKFYISKDDQCISMPKNNFKIQYFKNSANRIISFLVTDEFGRKYEFADSEYSESIDYSQEMNGYYNSKNGSAWHLSKITLTNGQVISFEYKLVNLTYTITNQSFSCPTYSNICTPSLNSVDVGIVSPNRFLTRIFWNEGEILFHSNTIRQDIKKLGTHNNVPKIDEIVQKNLNGETIKKIIFSHSYFGSNDLLRLDSVRISGGENSISEVYKFEYHNGIFPSLNEFKSQDLWGYYNGESNAILPKISILKGSVWRYPDTYPSPLRKPDYNKAVSGALKKIIYPTNGSSEFVYEPNKIVFKELADIPLGLHDHFADGTMLMGLESNVVNGSDAQSAQFTLTKKTLVRIEMREGQNDPSMFGTASAVFSATTNGFDCYNTTENNNGSYSVLRTTECIKILEPGTYSGSVSTMSIDGYFSQARIYVYRLAEEPNVEYIVGGIRIKQIITSNGSGNIENKYFQYPSLLNDGNINYAFNGPIRFISSYTKGVCGGADNHGNYSPVSCGDILTVHGSLLEKYKAVPLHYFKVVEKSSENESQGATEYLFEKGDAFWGTLYPNGSVSPFVCDWRDGSLVEKKIITKSLDGLSDQVLSIEQNEYNNSPSSYIDLDFNIQIGLTASIATCVGGTGYQSYYPGLPISDAQANTMSLNSFRTGGSPMKTEDYRLVRRIRTEYDQPNQNSIVSTVNYTYHSTKAGLPIEEVFIDSKGNTLTKKIKYTSDYNGGVFENLNSNNIIYPVETIFQKKSGTNPASIISGEVTFFSNTMPLPNRKMQLHINQPIAATSFTNSYIDQSGVFVVDPLYSIVVDNVIYDSQHNMIEYKNNNEGKVANIYNYKSSLLIAQALNASNAEIFHDNFEDLSGWDGSLTAYDNTKSRTGKYSGRIDKTGSQEQVSHSSKWLTISLTTPKKFRYSTWVYSDGPTAEILLFMKRANETGYFSYVTSVQTNVTNKWVLIEGEYNVPADVTQLGIRLDNNGGGSVWFDDVRLHPSDAMMTTYTYKPLVGMTSQSDVNNRITYYEYDAFNRLSIVRDQDGKIVKKICYNYYGQPDECTATANWQNTGNTRCKPCPSNSNYSSNVLQNEQRDLNPNSATYNQTQWVDAGTSSSCGGAVYENEGSPYCEQNGSGQNTGNQLQLQRDKNPCSPTYNQTQVVLVGYNTITCPLPTTCNWSNCSGPQYRCVYGTCEQGYKVYTDSYYNQETGMTVCVYHYEWSDGTWSQDYYENNPGGVFCPIMA